MANRDIKGSPVDKGVFATRLEMALSGRIGKYEGTITTQKKLAEATGIKPQTISQYCGAYGLPNAQKLADIADYFDVSADYLLGRTEITTPSAQMAGDYLEVQERTIQHIKEIDPLVLDFLFCGISLRKKPEGISAKKIFEEAGLGRLIDEKSYLERAEYERSISHSIVELLNTFSKVLRNEMVSFNDGGEPLLDSAKTLVALTTKGRFEVRPIIDRYREEINAQLSMLSWIIDSELEEFSKADKWTKQEVVGEYSTNKVSEDVVFGAEHFEDDSWIHEVFEAEEDSEEITDIEGEFDREAYIRALTKAKKEFDKRLEEQMKSKDVNVFVKSREE